MSPILVRPVREQLEHDRLIRHLEQKYKKKLDVAINVGEEQVVPVKIGALLLFPDLVLTSGRKLAGLVEVETGESVNNLEAMAQWVHFARSRVPFHLYVPVIAYETARRLCDANHAQVSEVWTYRATADGFDLVRMSSDPGAIKVRGPAATLPPRPAVKPAEKVDTPAAPPPAVPPPPPPKSAPAAKPPAKAATPPAKSAAKAAPKPQPPVKPKPAAKPARKAASKPAPKPARKPPAAKRKATAGSTRRR